MPPGGTRSSRSFITCKSLCFIFQAVFRLTPGCRASSSDETPCLPCVSRRSARNRTVSGSWVAAKIVPATREVRRWQAWHCQSLRERMRQCRREPHSGQRKPSGQRALKTACSHCPSLP